MLMKKDYGLSQQQYKSQEAALFLGVHWAIAQRKMNSYQILKL